MQTVLKGLKVVTETAIDPHPCLSAPLMQTVLKGLKVVTETVIDPHPCLSAHLCKQAAITVSKPMKLSLRIPCFASGATITTSSSSSSSNGKSGNMSKAGDTVVVSQAAPSCAFFPLNVEQPGTTVTIEFDMPITFYR
jgi:hypothetical protein